MSPLLRASIIIILILIYFCISVYQRTICKDIAIRSYTYLFFLSLAFPFLDISFGNSINLLDSSSLLFLLINFDIFKKIRWSNFSLIILFVIILFITSLSSDFVLNSLNTLCDRLSGFIVFMAVVVLLSNREKQYGYIMFAKLLKFPIFYAILWGVIQLTFMPYFSIYYSVYTEEARISSCFREPQTAGCIIAIFALYEWSKFSLNGRWVNLLIVGILFIIGCYTGSKTFLIGFLVGFLLIFLKDKLSPKKFIFSVILLLLILFTESYWRQLPVVQRFLNVDESYSYRQEVFWAQGLQIFLDNWLGIGIGNFQKYIEENQIALTHWHGGDNIYATQPESGYLLWLDEIGVFSVIYILLLCILLKKKGYLVCNVLLVVPWFISFISVYNLESRHMVFILFMVSAFIYGVSRKKEYIIR